MNDNKPNDPLTLTQKITALKESTLPDGERLQVLIALCEGLSIKVDAILDRLFLEGNRNQ